MKGFPKAPTVFDLLKPASYQYLKGLFSKFDINVDPKILILENKNKESILQKILSDLDNSPKIINVSRQSFFQITDNEVVEILSQEKNLKDLRILNIIRCLLLNAMMEKAVASFVFKKKMKKLRRALHEILVSMANAEYARQVLISEDERIKMQELNARMNQVMLDEMRLFYNTSFRQLSEIHEQIVDCNDRIIQHKEKKKELKKMLSDESKQAAQKIINEYRDRKTGENPFENFKSDLLGEVIDQYQKQMGKAEWELETLDEKDKEDAIIENTACEREDFLRDQLKNIKDKEIKLKYASKTFPCSKPMVRVSSSEMKMIEDEKKEIEHELIEIKDMRELRNKQMQERAATRQKIQYGFSDILPNIIKEKNDPTLNKILNDTMAMNHLIMSASLKIGEIVEDYKRKNKEISVVQKEKQGHLNRADQYRQSDEKLMEYYRNFPSHQKIDPQVALQREQNSVLHEQIYQAALAQKEIKISKQQYKK